MVDDVTVFGGLEMAEAGSVSTNGRVLYFPFTTNEAGVVTDESGTGNTGTVYQAVWTDEGKIGGGMWFDGVNDYVYVNDNSTLDITESLSVFAWIYPRTVNKGAIVAKYDYDTDMSYCLLLDYDDSGKLAVNLSSNGLLSGRHTGYGDTVLTANQWQFAGFTYTGATARIYLDGVQDGSFSHTGGLHNSSQPLQIGVFDASMLAPFDATIDEVMIYNRALSATEIYQLYLAGVTEHSGPTTHIPPQGDLSMGVYTNTP